MEIVDSPPEKFDASEFVNYMSEDLTTPTERELNEELPEWKHREAVQKKIEEKASKPRRGVGFLRAETKPEKRGSDSDSTEMDDSAFGEGIDAPSQSPAATPEVTDGSNESSDDKVNSEDETVPKRRGRKRRSRRGRRSRSTGDSSTTSNSSAAAPSTTEGEISANKPSGSDTDSAKDGQPSGNRRSRNRRRRRRGPKPSGGDAGSSPSTSGD